MIAAREHVEPVASRAGPESRRRAVQAEPCVAAGSVKRRAMLLWALLRLPALALAVYLLQRSKPNGRWICRHFHRAIHGWASTRSAIP